jgi:two-component system cell cycle sensor histidine kinase/response regulator CckA
LKKDNDKSFPEDDKMDREEQQRRSIQEYIFHLEESQDLAEELALVQEENLEYTVSVLRATLESTADGILVVDLKGKIVSYNQRFADMWGIPEDVLAHHSDKQAIAYVLKQLKYPAAFQDRIKDLDNRPEDQSVDIIEFRDGRIFQRYSQPQSIEDRIVGRVWSFRDVTDQRRAEEALRQSEEKYRALINLASDGILLTHLDGNLLEINNKMMELLGQTPVDILPTYFAEIFPPGEQEKIRATLQAIMEAGEGEINDTCIKDQDGQFIPVDITGSVVNFDSKTVVQWIFRETTERKKLEEERRKISNLESLGILAGGIAHDFNNLIMAILGNISLTMLDGQLSKASLEQLEEAEKACQRAHGLAGQLLTFAKGGMPVRKPANLGDLIREAANLSLSGTRSRCEILISADLWPVEVDEGQIHQVLNNLLLNANQAMPGGGVMQIRGENTLVGDKNSFALAPGRYVKLTLADHGIGIQPKYLGKIFDPYFTTKQVGSGLGLATVYSIIKNHAGNIAVESEMGVGTTFFIYLPATATKILPAEKPQEKLVNGHGRILVMDDDELVQSVLGRMLTMIGYEAAYARNGHEALKLYQKAKDSGQPFKAVILDLTIPGNMGGEEAIKKLKEIDPQVKAILSSGYGDSPVMTEFEKHGFAAFIAKPYKMVDLSKKLRHVIDK